MDFFRCIRSISLEDNKWIHYLELATRHSDKITSQPIHAEITDNDEPSLELSNKLDSITLYG